MESLTRDEIVRLSPSERIALIAQLWDSLDDAQIPLTSAQQQELERRLASLDDPQSGDRQNGVTWAVLKAELERRLVRYKQPKLERRKPGGLKGKIWISPDFDREDKEIEALFYDSPIEPPL